MRKAKTPKKKQIAPFYKTLSFRCALFIGILGFALYSNTLNHDYVLDDFSAIKENNIVRQGLPAIKEIFSTSYRQGYLSVKDGLYRPLSLLTFAAEWQYFPDQPGVAHFTNAILYGLTGFVLFFFLIALLERSAGLTEKKTRWIAFITCLLFITHPLHVEVVANIKSRDEILCFLLAIFSWFSVLKFLDEKRTKWIVLAVVSFFLSLLSKESSITFLALIPIGIFFFRQVEVKKILSVTGLLVLTAGIYLYLRSRVLEGALADSSVSIADNVLVGANTFSEHVGTAFYILASYLKLFVFPHPLSYDYSFKYLSITGLSNPAALLAFLIYGALSVWGVLLLVKATGKKGKGLPGDQRMAGFAILFFMGTILLFSNLILTIGTSMGDRLMYFPSLGFCLGAAILLNKFLNPASDRTDVSLSFFLKPKGFLILLIPILFSLKTYSRNADWKDNYTLYSHDVKLVPESVKAHYYLGLELIKVQAGNEQNEQKKKQLYEEGIRELERSVQIMPTFGNAYTQMGVAWYRMKNFEKAIENYTKAEKLKPHDAITMNNIGSVYFEWGKYREAEERFRVALDLNPSFVDAHMNLGSVLGTLGNFQGAIESFTNATRFAPDHAKAYFYLGITYEKMGDAKNADLNFQTAARLDPNLKR